MMFVVGWIGNLSEKPACLEAFELNHPCGLVATSILINRLDTRIPAVVPMRGRSMQIRTHKNGYMFTYPSECSRRTAGLGIPRLGGGGVREKLMISVYDVDLGSEQAPSPIRTSRGCYCLFVGYLASFVAAFGEGACAKVPENDRLLSTPLQTAKVACSLPVATFSIAYPHSNELYYFDNCSQPPLILHSVSKTNFATKSTPKTFFV
jgi:hypothetical protein